MSSLQCPSTKLCYTCHRSRIRCCCCGACSCWPPPLSADIASWYSSGSTLSMGNTKIPNSMKPNISPYGLLIIDHKSRGLRICRTKQWQQVAVVLIRCRALLGQAGTRAALHDGSDVGVSSLSQAEDREGGFWLLSCLAVGAELQHAPRNTVLVQLVLLQMASPSPAHSNHSPQALSGEQAKTALLDYRQGRSTTTASVTAATQAAHWKRAATPNRAVHRSHCCCCCWPSASNPATPAAC